MPSITQDYLPLKCRTEKFCITTGFFGGNCKDTPAYGRAEGVVKVNVKTKEDIEKFMAGEILSCWQMMGQGQVSLFSQVLAKEFGVGQVYPTCVICSRIAFDKASLEKSKIDLETINPTQYMETHIPSGKTNSYMEIITGEGTAGFSAKIELQEGGQLTAEDEKLQQDTLQQAGVPSDSKLELVEVDKEPGKYDEMSVLFTQISAPGHADVFWNDLYAGFTLLVGAKTITSKAKILDLSKMKLTIPSNVGLVKVTDSSGLLRFDAAKRIFGIKVPSVSAGWPLSKFGTVVAAVGVVTGALAQYNVYESRAITAGKCQDVKVGGEAGDGCSVVRLVNYNVDEIKTYCSVIESLS
jgi:hypothetical protein